MYGVVRLAGGVVPGHGLRAWAPRPGGVPVDADEASLPPGAVVVVGPEDADDARVRQALAGLAALVSAGGPVAAGAGVDLGAGFWSARLDGARGDRRDAVLAALRVVGLDGMNRLGDRTSLLVALFGPAATKPVGAAATEAIRQGRWAALELASAASDVLGPEQLEQVLALTAPDGVDPVPPGVPSTLAEHLGRVLDAVPRPRRLDLIVDLWAQVCAYQGRAARRARLVASQAREDRVDGMRRRYQHLQDELLLDQVRITVGHEPSLVEAARWIPGGWYWAWRLAEVVRDAMAATVLLRTAVAVSDHGLAEGLARCRTRIAAAAPMIDSKAAGQASRRVQGLPGVPARPGCYVRDLHARLSRDAPLDDKTAAYVTQRLARARDYGILVMEAAADLVHTVLGVVGHGHVYALESWGGGGLRDWRLAAGYTPVRPPAGWEQPGLFHQDTPGPSLAERLRERPDAPPVDEEAAGDLLWYADLADALAQLYGHDAATVEYGPYYPQLATDPPPPEPAPLVPRPDTVPLAVAGAAQLVSLGGQVPRRCRTWAELVDGLLAGTAVAEALTGTFRLPSPLAGLDGTTVPGTGARLELARDPRKLAEWSDHMGNCIAGQDYIDDAVQGRCGLAALRDPGGRILANVELRPASHGWRIVEIRARFNGEPDQELAERFARWVATIPPATPARPVAAPRPARTRGGRPSRRRSPDRLVQDVAEPLTGLAERALADAATVDATKVLATLAGFLSPRGEGAAAPLLAVTGLRRASQAQLVQVCREALGDPPGGPLPLAEAGGPRGRGRPLRLAELWDATAVRPMATALAALDPDLLARHDHLGMLADDVPLLAAQRRLARRPGVTTGLLCALVIRVTCWGDPARHAAPRGGAAAVTVVSPAGAVAVPGFPASNLNDGPWQRAWPDAAELGATTERFWDQIAAGGLLVPTDWLASGGGWSALWNRAARNSRGRAR